MAPFTAAPFGGTARTYLPLGVSLASAFVMGSATTNIIGAVIWE